MVVLLSAVLSFVLTIPVKFSIMQKFSLYDPERDVMVDVRFSPDDFKRAQTDMVFATSLLNAAIKEKHITTNECNIELVPIQQTTPMVHKPAHTETKATMNIESDTDDGGSIYRWSAATVLLLLDTYKTFEEKFSNGKYSHKKIWDEISAILAEKGHMITGPQCAAKLRSLKKTYKSVKDHNNISGNDRRTWQFYEIMDEIFSKRAWCSPVAVASSTGLSIRQDKDPGFASAESTSEPSTPKEKSTQKENICNLLKRRLHQKIEHEEAKIKRHKERMEMDEKFLAVFTKLAQK